MSPTRTYLRLSAGFLPTRSAVSVQKHCHREYRRPSFILAWVIFAAHCYNYRYTFRIVAADLSGRGLMWLKHSASCRRPMFGSLEPYRKRDSLIFWAMFIVFLRLKVYVCGFYLSTTKHRDNCFSGYRAHTVCHELLPQQRLKQVFDSCPRLSVCFQAT